MKLIRYVIGILLAAITLHAQTVTGTTYAVNYPNDPTTGTQRFTLTKLTATQNAVTMATTDTAGYIGVCIERCGTTGTALIAVAGIVQVHMDGAGSALDYVVISTSNNGWGSDAGSTYPTTTTDVVGQLIEASAGSGSVPRVSLSSGRRGGSGSAIVVESTPYIWLPFPGEKGTSDGSRVVPQSSAVNYFILQPAPGQITDHIRIFQNGSGSNHIAAAIYTAGCVLQATSSTNAFTGGSYIDLTLATTLIGNTTYYLAISSDSANDTDTLGTSNYGAALQAAVPAGMAFSGANSATWVGPVVTFPPTCGAKTNITGSGANDFPWALIY